MATWDDNFWFGKDTGKQSDLKTCPFNVAHKLKPTSYHQHVLKCEQSFPSQRLASHSTLASVATIGQSLLSVKSIDSDIERITGSLSQLSTSECSIKTDNWIGRTSPDSAIDVKTNSSGNSTENEDQNNHTDVTLTALGSVQDSRQNNGVSASSLQREPAVPIVPQIAQTDPVKEDAGAGDPDDWNNSNAPHFDIYKGFDNCNELTDEQVMDMADSFIDTVILNKMDKSKRKKLYDKLIELRKAGDDRQRKAIKELLATEEVHPQITNIPPEIRKPKVDIREIFKFKKENNKVETLKKSTFISPESEPIPNGVKSPEPVKCPPNPWTLNELTGGLKTEKNPKSLEPSISGSSASDHIKAEAEESADRKLEVCCNNCWMSLTLNAENIKRMTVFCDKCSGIKFGGYFECQQCKLYGYFAQNQIQQHLDKHFPK